MTMDMNKITNRFIQRYKTLLYVRMVHKPRYNCQIPDNYRREKVKKLLVVSSFQVWLDPSRDSFYPAVVLSTY